RPCLGRDPRRQRRRLALVIPARLSTSPRRPFLGHMPASVICLQIPVPLHWYMMTMTNAMVWSALGRHLELENERRYNRPPAKDTGCTGGGQKVFRPWSKCFICGGKARRHPDNTDRATPSGAGRCPRAKA